MIKVSDIRQIVKDAKVSGHKAACEADVVFAVLCGQLAYKELAYKYAYGTDDTKQAEAHFLTERISFIVAALRGYCATTGSNGEDTEKDLESSLTKEQNTQEYIRLIARTEEAMRHKRISEKDGLKLIGEYRTRLNDKFVGMEEENKEQHIIIVPAKHDLICPHTNKECYQWPSKEACMEHYNLTNPERD